MKQIEGQMDLFTYLEEQESAPVGCSSCVCRECLYWWSGRCPAGTCHDDRRAKDNPYDKAHPGKTPRTSWSDWKKPGEQAHWCRGGIFYPASYCANFVKYEGSEIEDCVAAVIQVFQDGHINCSLKDSIGCEACMKRAEGEETGNRFDCEWMTDTGCERMITAKNLMLQSMLEGEDIEMCKEQCCRGCTKFCGYRCGQAY